jgi:hypothetical protein
MVILPLNLHTQTRATHVGSSKHAIIGSTILTILAFFLTAEVNPVRMHCNRNC